MVPDNSLQPQTKASLKAWLHQFAFAQRAKKESELRKAEELAHPVFGKPLKDSLKYASVQISTANVNGELCVWGYIPVVVAKCGLYLKEHATGVEGTFRVNGSNKRMRDLQAVFETPPRYGKSINWKQEHYTTHDVASVFRRYLTQMPEPVIPYNLYHDFRNALGKQPFNQDEVIMTYRRLIRSMPLANQYLLLYVLDLLSVFSRKSDQNLMSATNLAVIFRPGIIAHPSHEMSPHEHHLSQRVLEFLIEHQDWFMLDIPPLPTQSRPGSPEDGTGSDIDDIMVVPSSDDEYSHIGGGWRLVGKDTRRVSIQQTPPEHHGSPDRSTRGRTEDSALSSVAEHSPAHLEQQRKARVERRRTLPAWRVEGGTAERAKVLRKQKRSSSSQPIRPDS